jgi:hypothetical protein
MRADSTQYSAWPLNKEAEATIVEAFMRRSLARSVLSHGNRVTNRSAQTGIPVRQKWSFASNDELVGTQFFDFEIVQYVCATFIRGNYDPALVENSALRLRVPFIFKDSSAFRIAPKAKVYVCSVRIVPPIVYVGFPHHGAAS